eukprot:RCo040705
MSEAPTAALIAVGGLALAVAAYFACRRTPSQGGPHEPKKHVPVSLRTPPEEVARTLRLGVVRTAWNEEMVTNMWEGVRGALLAAKVPPENITVEIVPGSYELPVVASYMAKSGNYDAVLCLGVLIKGETAHFEYISSSVSRAIMEVQTTTGVPVLFGVLTCFKESQAIARTRLGAELPQSLGVSLLHMAEIRRRWQKSK